MDKVNSLLGNIQMTKVNSVQVAAIDQRQDVYLAKINNGTVDKIGVIAMVPHSEQALSYNVLAQIPWHSLHVRSYNSEKLFVQALKKIASENQLMDLEPQSVARVDWGNDDDVELVTDRITVTSSTYNAPLPFKVTLHSQYTENKFGHELENVIEFIPALQTYNFTLVK